MQKTKEENLEYHRAYYRAHPKRQSAIKEHRRIQAKVNSQYVSALKENGCCAYCGEEDDSCLDFHHVNSAAKLMDVSSMMRNSYAMKTLIKEIAKCVMLCANCHRKLHAGHITLDPMPV